MRIEVEFLRGTAYASDGVNETEWPTHPARLFFRQGECRQGGGQGKTADEARRWEESHGPPEIRIGEAAENDSATRLVRPNYPRFPNPSIEAVCLETPGRLDCLSIRAQMYHHSPPGAKRRLR